MVANNRYLARGDVFKISREKLEALHRIGQMLVHDVRQPFSTIQMAISYFSKTDKIDQVHSLVEALSQTVDNAAKSVDAMLADITDFEKETVLTVSQFSIRNLIIQCCEDMALVFNSKKVEVEQLYQSEDWLIEGDLEKIKRVFRNILGNAYQATGRKGKITIEAKRSEGCTFISILNTGSSIPADKIEYIFESFYSEGKRGGTGLGLAIARKFVEKHGGKIWVESDVVENLCKFCFTLKEAPVIF